MKSHEFLKAAADFFGGEVTNTAQPAQPNQATLVQVEPETEDLTDQTTMVSPLQQKHEMFKQAFGTETSEEPTDELVQMKKLAGMFTASDDVEDTQNY